MRLLRRFPLQPESAPERRAASAAITTSSGAQAQSRTRVDSVPRAMASFICHNTSSLNCRISNARSCAARVLGNSPASPQARTPHHAAQGSRGSGNNAARPIDPRIVLRPARQPLLVNLRRKQLGQRGTGRLLPRRAPRKIHIGVDRKPDPRHDALRLSTCARVTPVASPAAATTRCRPGHHHSHRDRGCAAPTPAVPRDRCSWPGWPHL